MNSLWNAAADQVTNVLHIAAAHPFGTFCWVTTGTIVTIGVKQILKEKREAANQYLEQKKALDAIPDPPMMRLTPISRTPRDPN